MLRFQSLDKLIFCALSLLIFQGCNFKRQRQAEAASITASPTPIGYSYSDIRSAIFEPSCISCHGATAATTGGGYSLATYESTVAILQRIKASVQSDSMPLGGPALSAAKKDMLYAWINAGAPDKVTSTTSGLAFEPAEAEQGEAVEALVTDWTLNYANVKTQIFDVFCVSCHTTSANPADPIGLESYALVSANIDDIAEQTIVYRAMPKTGTKLSRDQSLLLWKWIKAGAPEF